MHTNETKDRFLELRAKGLSLAHIAQDLNVSKRTLVDWNREMQSDLRALRAVETEALYDRVLATRETNVKVLSELHEKVVDTLAYRELNGLRTKELVRLFLLLNREIGRVERVVTSLYDAQPLPPPPAPAQQPPPAPPEPNAPVQPASAPQAPAADIPAPATLTPHAPDAPRSTSAPTPRPGVTATRWC